MERVDTSWLTEAYLNDLGYYKISDDGQYGVYKNKHHKVSSLTYGPLPFDYRALTFNRDTIGVHLGVTADWGTRHSIRSCLVVSREIFETLLNACT